MKDCLPNDCLILFKNASVSKDKNGAMVPRERRLKIMTLNATHSVGFSFSVRGTVVTIGDI